MNRETAKKVNLDINNGEELSSLAIDVDLIDYYSSENIEEDYDYNAWMYENDDYIPPQKPTSQEQQKTAQALSLLSRIKGQNQPGDDEDWTVDNPVVKNDF